MNIYQQKLNLTVPLFIFIAILSVAILQYSIVLIHNEFLDKGIKITSVILLLISIKNIRLSRETKNIVYWYGALFVSAFIGAVVTADIIGIIQLYKIVFMFLIFPVILLSVPPKSRPPDILLKIPLFWGTLFSFQSIILFCFTLFAIPIEPTVVELGTCGGIPAVRYGMLGYANIENFSAVEYKIIRVQSWFLEPSLFAAYLFYPILVSFGYYKSTKKKLYLLISFLCLLSFAMTFSLAGFFSLLASTIFLLCVRPVSKRNANHIKGGLLTRITLLIAIAGFVIVAQFIMSKLQDLYDPSTYSATAYTKLLARNSEGPSGALFREQYKQEQYIDALKQSPLGQGLGHTLGTNELTSGNAFVFWAVSGGVLAIIVLLMLYMKLFFSYCLPLLRSRYSPYRFIGAAFVGTTVHGLSYGNWVSPFYLYIVAVTVLCAVYEIIQCTQIKKDTFPKIV